MRKFRNAALAAATATAVAFGGTAVASAEDAPKPATSSTFTSGSSKLEKDGKSVGDVITGVFKGPGLFQAGLATDAGTPAELNKVFGSSVDDSETPAWALIWRDALNWMGLAIGIGAVIGIANAALNQGLLPQIPW